MWYCSLRSHGKGPYYGGEQVDQTINAVFAALIWHCQDLREELTNEQSTHQPSQLLHEAFSTAEALRRELVNTLTLLMCGCSQNVCRLREDRRYWKLKRRKKLKIKSLK